MSAGRKNNTQNKDWNTPPKYTDAVLSFYQSIDLDPCSNEFSLVPATIRYVLPINDGLKDTWGFSRIFVNPPYGRNNGSSIYDWIQRGISANQSYKSEVLYLIPVATNTKHFKELIFKSFNGICFLNDTRLKFYKQGVEDKKGAPMACCMCYIGHRFNEFENVFSYHGKVFNIT